MPEMSAEKLADLLAGAYRAVRAEYLGGTIDYLGSFAIEYDDGMPGVIVASAPRGKNDPVELLDVDEVASSLDVMMDRLTSLASVIDYLYVQISPENNPDEITVLVRTHGTVDDGRRRATNSTLILEEDIYRHNGYDADGYDRQFLDYDRYNEAGEYVAPDDE